MYLSHIHLRLGKDVNTSVKTALEFKLHNNLFVLTFCLQVLQISSSVRAKQSGDYRRQKNSH